MTREFREVVSKRGLKHSIVWPDAARRSEVIDLEGSSNGSTETIKRSRRRSPKDGVVISSKVRTLHKVSTIRGIGS